MQKSKTRSEKRSPFPGAAAPQKAKFSLDDPLALPFPPRAPMRTATARQLLDQDGHSALTSPRRRTICRDIKIQIGTEQFPVRLGARHSPSSWTALFVCTACFVLVSLGVPALGGGAEGRTDAWSPTVRLILSHKHRQNTVSGCFFFLCILKMLTRSSFHFFSPLCCPRFLNTAELSPALHHSSARTPFGGTKGSITQPVSPQRGMFCPRRLSRSSRAPQLISVGRERLRRRSYWGYWPHWAAAQCSQHGHVGTSLLSSQTFSVLKTFQKT